MTEQPTQPVQPAAPAETPAAPVPAAAPVAATPVAPLGKPTITFDDFAKLDLRTGKVLEIRDHPNADKLYVLTVDLGNEKRQIIAGLRAYVPAEALLGKNIIVVANLAPRKMRGLESQGMLLAASWEEGESRKVIPLTTAVEIVPPGSSIS